MDTAPMVLQLAGHPLRWGLLSELGRSDRTVRELTDLVQQPQNLVSYHLAKLREGGLVSSRQSSADGRDSYYRADLGQFRSFLAATALALHPGIALAPAELDRPPEGSPRPRVLFLCTGNSARSQIAEALLHARSGGQVEARSAGSHPKPLHPNAVRVARDVLGIDLTDRRSKHLDEFTDERFDRVITLCDRVREICPEFPGGGEAVHWSMADPAAGDLDDDASYPGFRATVAELEARIGFLLGSLRHRPDHQPPTPKGKP
jgi:protein-tyrosine-phosphatase